MEIEIKLLLPPNAVSASLSDWPALASLQHCKNRLLGNVYFDTPELLLRQRYMGLRIRSVDDLRELTLKTAGKVVGGLHSRPEYNVDICSDQPDLSLLPSELFAADDIPSLNEALTPLFSTNFNRQQGVLTIPDAAIEVALDFGEVRVGQQSDEIAELELELIEGEAKALLPLVAELMQQLPLRLGGDSKAARGYRLAGLQQACEVSEWKQTEAELLTAWQRNEQQLLAGNRRAKPLLVSIWKDVAELLPQHQPWLMLAMTELQCSENGQQELANLLADKQYGLIQLDLFSALLD